VLFELSAVELVLVIVALVGGGAALGVVAGRRSGDRAEDSRETTSVLQGTLIGFVGLLLAFGLSLAIERYQDRRAAVVDEAGALETTYLRAQTLPEPMRTTSLELLARYTDARIDVSTAVPDSGPYERATTSSARLQRPLWRAAGAALDAEPDGSAVRLYVDALNRSIDTGITQRAALANRLPDSVSWLMLVGASVALAALGFHFARSERAIVTVAVAAGIVILIIFVTFDLDRPRRGLVKVPETPLIELREAMDLPPAAAAPTP
jgi:hypothetical protein